MQSMTEALFKLSLTSVRYLLLFLRLNKCVQVEKDFIYGSIHSSNMWLV